MAAPEKTVSGSAPGLRRDAIGLREVLFQSITDMAPAAAMSYVLFAFLAVISIVNFRLQRERVEKNGSTR